MSNCQPDNCRPVDYNLRRRLLAELEETTPEAIWARVDEGLPKLWMTSQALHLRRRRPQVFGSAGEYQPLQARGSRAEVDALAAQLGRHLVLIAESDLNDPRVVRPPELGGYGLAAQWSDDFHHAWHTVLSGERDGYYADFGSLADLAHAMQQAFVYDGRYAVYRGRHHGRPVGWSVG